MLVVVPQERLGSSEVHTKGLYRSLGQLWPLPLPLERDEAHHHYVLCVCRLPHLEQLPFFCHAWALRLDLKGRCADYNVLFALAALFKNVFKIRKGSFKDWKYFLNLTKDYVTQYAGLNTV